MYGCEGRSESIIDTELYRRPIFPIESVDAKLDLSQEDIRRLFASIICDDCEKLVRLKIGR